MNFRTLRYHLLEKGYTEEEIEEDLSSIADDIYSNWKDEKAEQEYANQE